MGLIAGVTFSISLPLMMELSWIWGWLAFGIGGVLYVALICLTYYRLKNAALSGWWLLPMVVVLHIGPRWELATWEWGWLAIQPSGIISLVPVIIGWFADTSNPQGSATS